ncbi:MAG: hypothetical protein LBP22_14890 [Deltaproteobacteria bacterium]|nr:hypothetical protein [Deltaproteobacteria bacterium]
MKKLLSLALVFGLLLIPGLVLAQLNTPTNNQTFAVQPQATSEKKIDVVYFIYYGNFDCQLIEPKLEAFAASLPENVSFEVLPVVVARSYVSQEEYYTVNQYADLFFTLDYFGQEKMLRNEIFQKVMDTLANTGEFALVDMDYQLGFLKEYDITQKEYLEAMESEKTDRKIEKALNYIEKFRLETVPAVVVNGQLLVPYNANRGADVFFKTVNQAIEKALAQKSVPAKR